MFKCQCSMNAFNVCNHSIHLNNCCIDYSLFIDHCSLIIASEGGTELN